MTTHQLLNDTIEMFLEYRDQHGYEESEAKTKAVAEILEGVNAERIDAILDAQSVAHVRLISINQTLDKLDPDHPRYQGLLKDALKLEAIPGH